MPSEEGNIWTVEVGQGPFIATAIHDGHEVRDDVKQYMALDDPSRLREEDPFTGRWAEIAPTRVVGLRSRFQVDLNRPREAAVYLTPADAWGLQVWKERLPDDVARESLQEYDAFYDALRDLYADMTAKYGRFVVYDLHTYNHRRDGSDGSAADPEGNPQVNIGTGTLKDRTRFAPVIDRLICDLSQIELPAGGVDFAGGKLDVRENVKFFGGNHPRWAHETFPDSACVIAIEFKKFFMDEWTGEPDFALVDAIGKALAATVPGVLEELENVPPSAAS